MVKYFDKSLQPKLFGVIKEYNGKTFVSDLIAGIIVAIIALPLSIALAIASGVGPNEGLYTAIVAGFVIAVLGGSRVQISGPTAAFSTIVASIILKHGMDTLILSTIVAGIFLILFGILKLGKYITKIPNTIVIGFTAGIALNIFVGQIKDFLGISYLEGLAPISSIDKIIALIKSAETINVNSLIIGTISLLILIFVPKILKKIPASLIALIIATLLVLLLHLNVLRINDLYVISNSPMKFKAPNLALLSNPSIYTNGFIIAILAAIESLLACMVSDKMLENEGVIDTHHSNAELVAQGLGNIASVLFGGIPATGALARTGANVKNGGKTPVAGIIHTIILFLVLIGGMTYVGMIPMPTIASLLFTVAYNMAQIPTINKYIKSKNIKDIFILFITFFLTFVFNLVIGIAVALVLWFILNKLLNNKK